MQYTQNYNLKKPDPNDTFNKQNDNDNMDIIDAQLHANAQAIADVQNKVNASAALGTSNQDVDKFNALIFRVDTRSNVVTRDQNGKITKIEEKDGDTTVLSTSITRDANGKISSITETVTDNGMTTTVITTLNRDANGKITGTTRSVS